MGQDYKEELLLILVLAFLKCVNFAVRFPQHRSWQTFLRVWTVKIYELQTSFEPWPELGGLINAFERS